MLKDLSLEHINAAVNSIDIIAKHHRCDEPIKLASGVQIPCLRTDIIEFFDKSGAIRGVLVVPKKIFGWDRIEYRIETVWDIKKIIQNND